jgi:hypothetical protein
VFADQAPCVNSGQEIAMKHAVLIAGAMYRCVPATGRGAVVARGGSSASQVRPKSTMRTRPSAPTIALSGTIERLLVWQLLQGFGPAADVVDRRIVRRMTA